MLIPILFVVTTLLSADDPEISLGTTPLAERDPATVSTDSRQALVDNSDRPQVPPVACSGLITLEEIDIALDIPLANVIERKLRDETCRKELADQPEYWIQIEPGDPNDFVDRHTRYLAEPALGVSTGSETPRSGSSVENSGSRAGGSGVLAVFKETRNWERSTVPDPD